METVDVAALLEGVPTVDRRKGGARRRGDRRSTSASCWAPSATRCSSDAPLGVWTYRHGARPRASATTSPTCATSARGGSPATSRSCASPTGRCSPARRCGPTSSRCSGSAARRCCAAGTSPAAVCASCATGWSPSRGPEEPEVTAVAPDRPSRRVAGACSCADRSPGSPAPPRPQRALARAVAARACGGRRTRAAAARASPAAASTARRAAATGPTRSPSASTAGRGCSSRRSRGAAATGTSASASSTSDGGLHDVRVALATPPPPLVPVRVQARRRELSAARVAQLVRHDAVPRARRSPTTGSRSCVLAGRRALRPDAAAARRRAGGCSARSPNRASPRTTSCTSSTPSALEGPWQAHPRNPVVSDVRGARPAGPFIADGARLLRPGAGLLRPLRARGRVQGGARAQPAPPTARSRWRGSSPTGSRATWRRTTTRPTSGGRRPTRCAAGGAGERGGAAPEAERGSFGAGLGLRRAELRRDAGASGSSRASSSRGIYGVRIVGEFALVIGADAGRVVAVEPPPGSRARARAEHAAGARAGGHRPVRRGLRGVVRASPRWSWRSWPATSAARVPRAARPPRPARPGAGDAGPVPAVREPELEPRERLLGVPRRPLAVLDPARRGVVRDRGGGGRRASSRRTSGRSCRDVLRRAPSRSSSASGSCAAGWRCGSSRRGAARRLHARAGDHALRPQARARATWPRGSATTRRSGCSASACRPPRSAPTAARGRPPTASTRSATGSTRCCCRRWSSGSRGGDRDAFDRTLLDTARYAALALLLVGRGRGRCGRGGHAHLRPGLRARAAMRSRSCSSPPR